MKFVIPPVVDTPLRHSNPWKTARRDRDSDLFERLNHRANLYLVLSRLTEKKGKTDEKHV